MASTLKCDTVTTLDGAGNITFSRPIVGDGSNLTGILPAVGSSGNVLTSNGSAWASATPAAGGKVLQAVNVLTNTASSTSSQFPADDSIPQNNEGTELMTLAITPQSASSKLHIHVQICGSKSNEAPIYWALFVDSTANALAWGGHYTANIGTPNTGSGFHVVNSSSTSARTYKICLLYTSDAADE